VLERQEIVSGRGPNELTLSNQHRWGAPLEEMTRRTLTQFQSDAARRVVLEGTWSLVPAGSDTPSLTRNVLFTQTASPTSYDDQVQAMSRNVGRLADDIASALAR